MKTKAIIPLVLGLCVGLVAVKFLVDSLQKARGSTPEANRITVVRARQDIGSQEAITAEMVELVPTVDNSFVPLTERITALEDVTGRVTAKTIPQNSPILKSMLAPAGTPAGMVGKIPPGFRAVSVRIDEVTGVAYQLKPGDWVDVIVVMDVDTGGRKRRKETIAEVFLQHVQILAIGQTTTGERGEGGQQVKPAKSATLLVAEEDVPKLHLAATRGKLTLAMRGGDDKITPAPPSARESTDFDFGGLDGSGPDEAPERLSSPTRASGPADFLSTFMAYATTTPRPPVAPEPPHGITIYHDSARGLQVEQVVFEHGESRRVVGINEGPIDRMDPANQRKSRGPRGSPGASDRTDPIDESVTPVAHSDSEIREVE